jgi:hypothetical protein
MLEFTNTDCITDLQVIRDELTKFSGIVFDEASHTYTKDTRAFQSCTGIIKNYYEPFSEVIAIKYAQKHGLSLEEVKAEWKLKGDVAAQNGTDKHKKLEDNFINKTKEFEEKDAHLLSFMNWFEEEGWVNVATELRVFDEDMMIAGSLDNLAWNVKRKILGIFDYKTGKRPEEKDSYVSDGKKKYVYKKMYVPFQNHYQSKLTIYSIQQQIYRFIIEKNTNLKIEEMWLIHLSDDSYEPIPVLDIDVSAIFQKTREQLYNELPF